MFPNIKFGLFHPFFERDASVRVLGAVFVKATCTRRAAPRIPQRISPIAGTRSAAATTVRDAATPLFIRRRRLVIELKVTITVAVVYARRRIVHVTVLVHNVLIVALATRVVVTRHFSFEIITITLQISMTRSGSVAVFTIGAVTNQRPARSVRGRSKLVVFVSDGNYVSVCHFQDVDVHVVGPVQRGRQNTY